MADAPVTPEVPVTPAAPTPAAPAAAATPESPFSKERLERTRRATLKEVGIKVKKGEDPTAKITEFKASKEERKAQRAADTAKITDLESKVAKLSGTEEAVKVYAELEFKSLTEAQQGIVTAAAGDDPSERLRVISIMKASAPAPAAAAETVKPADKPIPAPANTTVAGTAPPVATSTPTDVRAEYSRIAKTNPLAAAGYLLANREAYYQQPQ
jgi:hypothetical protein